MYEADVLYMEGSGDLQEECILCKREDRAKIEKDIIDGELSRSIVAQQIGMGVEDVFTHMNDHYGKGTKGYKKKLHDDDEESMEELYSSRKVLFDLVVAFKDRIDALLEFDSLNATDTNILVKTAAELRKTVETLAKLEGELKESMRVTVQLYLDMKSVVLVATEGHPEIREKIVAGLQEAEKTAIKTIKVEVPEVGNDELQKGSTDRAKDELLEP